jgi:hypothetical protein
MPFEPGQSGNPGGRRKAKPFLDALRLEAKAAENGEPCEAKAGSLRWNARKLLEAGEVATIKEVADRFDGKVAQAIVGDDDEDPINIVHRIERVVVRPNPINPDR